MQNAKRGISKVSVCWALKIFNWCQFHPFSKSLAIPTVQQFEGATSHPKGFGKVKTSIVFFVKFCSTIFFVVHFFSRIKFNSLHWMPVRPRNPCVGVLCGEGFWHLRKCCEVLNTSFLCVQFRFFVSLTNPFLSVPIFQVTYIPVR